MNHVLASDRQMPAASQILDERRTGKSVDLFSKDVSVKLKK